MWHNTNFNVLRCPNSYEISPQERTSRFRNLFKSDRLQTSRESSSKTQIVAKLA